LETFKLQHPSFKEDPIFNQQTSQGASCFASLPSGDCGCGTQQKQTKGTKHGSGGNNILGCGARALNNAVNYFRRVRQSRGSTTSFTWFPSVPTKSFRFSRCSSQPLTHASGFQGAFFSIFIL
jgi:hypothetical protein